MYKRKTYDDYQLHVNYGYGHGYEHECSADSWKDIRQTKKEYRENCPEYQTKIVIKRIKIIKEQ